MPIFRSAIHAINRPRPTIVECIKQDGIISIMRSVIVVNDKIRKQIAAGHSVKYLMPLEAWQYLDEMNFYR